jgi:hypothetical protein
VITAGNAWITLNTGASNGSGPLSVTLAPNATATPRSGSVNVNGVTLVVEEPGTGCGTKSIVPGAVVAPAGSFPSAGGLIPYTVTAGPNCPWDLQSTSAGGLVLAPGTGIGPGSVTVRIAPNTGAKRNVTFAFGGNVPLTVPQAAATAPTVFLQNQANNGVSAWFMGGPGNATITNGPWFATALPGWQLKAVGDMNIDGIPDLVYQNTVTNEVSIWFMNANLTSFSSAPIIYAAVPGWEVRAAADMNGDNVPDLILQNTTTFQISVWYMSAISFGHFFGSAPIIATAAPGWNLVAAGDINQDGVSDLVFQNATTYQISVWFMNSGGMTYVSAPIVANPAAGWRLVGVRDMDNDGVLDYVFQNGTGVSVWYMVGNDGTTYSSAPIIVNAVPDWNIKGVG